MGYDTYLKLKLLRPAFLFSSPHNKNPWYASECSCKCALAFPATDVTHLTYQHLARSSIFFLIAQLYVCLNLLLSVIYTLRANILTPT